LCPMENNLTPKQVLYYEEERIIDEVKSKQPLLTITLGDLPLHVLADTEYSVREIEGRVIAGKVGPVLPVTHPAYYLRRPEEAMDFIECLRAGVRILQGVYQHACDVTRTLVTEDNLQEVIAELWKYEHLSIDTETTGFDAAKMKPDKIIEAGISVGIDHAYIVPLKLIPPFKELIETKKGIYWNAQFDASFFMAMGIHPNVYFDGMLAHYCLDERKHSHGLKRVARVYLGSENWEAEIHKYIPVKEQSTFDYSNLPTDVRQKYLSYDAARTFQLWKVLEPEMKDNFPFWNILMPAARMFVEVCHRGVTIDPYKIVEVHAALIEDMEEEEKEMRKLAGEYFNPRSSQQVASIIYDKLQLIPPHFQNGPTTDKRYLDTFRKEHEFIDRLITYREMSKDVNTYFEGFARCIDKEFRVHPKMKLHGTETGRLSSEKPSVMNIKRRGKSRVKEMFVPHTPNRYLLELDLERAELVCYALIADDEEMIAILSQSPTPENPYAGDPHRLIAVMAFGEDKADEMRVPAKAVVFGRLYGRGLPSLRTQFGDEVATKLASTVDSMMPKLREYSNSIQKQIRTRGYVESFFGRKRRFPLITYRGQINIMGQAVNMPIQSTSSDINLLNMIYLHENLAEKYDAHPLFCVHDSIVIDIPDLSVVMPLKTALEEHGCELVQHKVKIAYEAKVGKNWGIAEKYKEV